MRVDCLVQKCFSFLLVTGPQKVSFYFRVQAQKFDSHDATVWSDAHSPMHQRYLFKKVTSGGIDVVEYVRYFVLESPVQ